MELTEVVFSYDGKRIAVHSDNGGDPTIVVFDAKSGAPLTQFAYQSNVGSYPYYRSVRNMKFDSTYNLYIAASRSCPTDVT